MLEATLIQTHLPELCDCPGHEKKFSTSEIHRTFKTEHALIQGLRNANAVIPCLKYFLKNFVYIPEYSLVTPNHKGNEHEKGTG